MGPDKAVDKRFVEVAEQRNDLAIKNVRLEREITKLEADCEEIKDKYDATERAMHKALSEVEKLSREVYSKDKEIEALKGQIEALKDAIYLLGEEGEGW